MQEQAVFREKYNFVKFEVLRIKSLLGGRKETAERKNSDDVSIRETIGEILGELKIYALKPLKKLLLVSAVCVSAAPLPSGSLSSGPRQFL